MNTQVIRRDDVSAPAVADTVTLLDVIRKAASDPSIDVEKMERLMAMHERILAKQAETLFNEAMSEAQHEMGRISTDATNPQTRSRYATYGKLDTALRPIYSRHGFSLSYDTGDGASEGFVRILCYVSRGGYTRTYKADMPADGKGAKGGDVMTKTHATGAAFTYGQRYLLKLIFNVAIGENDTDGNDPGGAITPEQKDMIVEMLRETGADVPKFLAYVGAPTVDDIPAKKYPAAIKALEAKRAKK